MKNMMSPTFARVAVAVALAANLSACAGTFTNTTYYTPEDRITKIGQPLEDHKVYRWVSREGVTACWETQAYRALNKQYREVDTLKFTGRYKPVHQNKCQ